MPEVSDEKLMQRYVKGDVTAFNELYQRHRGALYRYFFRQVSDPAVANDLYQGTWEKVIRSRNNFQSPAPFAAWLYRIAHNHLVDHYRRTRLSDELDNAALKDHKPDPSQAAIDDERHRQLHEGILGLPEDQRSALLLQLESGLKVQEIAFATGVSRETVKSRLRYAVNKLKRNLVT